MVKSASSKKGFSLSAFSTTRGQLFGLATLMIFFYHSFYINYNALLPDLEFLPKFINTLQDHCNSAVDIFLIMSGIGLYYSFSGNSSLKDFYKKRATRILPPVLIVAALWYGMGKVQGLFDYLGSVFFLNFYLEGVRYFWYFALIVVLYAVYPFLHKLLESTRIYGMLIIVIGIITINVILMIFAPEIYSRIEIALTRIPAFIIGAWMGKLVKDGKTISYLWLLPIGAVFAGILVFYYFKPLSTTDFLYVYRYVGTVYALSITFLAAAFFSKVKLGFVGTFLVWIGGYSMEIYLIQEKAVSKFFQTFNTNDPTYISFYIAIFVVTIILAMALKAMCTNLDKNLFYRNANKKMASATLPSESK